MAHSVARCWALSSRLTGADGFVGSGKPGCALRVWALLPVVSLGWLGGGGCSPSLLLLVTRMRARGKSAMRCAQKWDSPF